MKHIKRGELDKYIVEVPPTHEQMRISRVLSVLDAQIEAAEALIAKQERMRAGLLQDLFTRGVDEHGTLRPRREEAPHLYHETELGWLPRGWDIAPIQRSILAARAGCSVNSVSRPAYADEAGVLKTSCVANGWFLSHENKAVEPSEYIRLREPVALDCIVISRMNTPDLVGESGLVQAFEGRLFLPDRLWQLHLTPDERPFWLSRLFQSHSVKERIKALATGTSGTMKNIEKSKLLSLKIPHPKPDEKDKFSRSIHAIEANLGALSKSLEKAIYQKSGLTQDLLTNRVSVDALLESEPA
jgi:type I restriction enzyme S subunit